MARFGVPAAVRLVLLDKEGAEIADLGPFPAGQGVGDCIEKNIDGPFCFPFGKAPVGVSQLLDKLGFVHTVKFPKLR